MKNLYFRKRMTAHECLLHPWLMGDHSDRTTALNSSNYVKIRDQIRQKYSDWNSFAVPIGRISEYSALRKLMVEKYKIYESSFGKSVSLLICTSVLITNNNQQIDDKQPRGLLSSHRVLFVTKDKVSSSIVGLLLWHNPLCLGSIIMTNSDKVLSS